MPKHFIDHDDYGDQENETCVNKMTLFKTFEEVVHRVLNITGYKILICFNKSKSPSQFLEKLSISAYIIHCVSTEKSLYEPGKSNGRKKEKGKRKKENRFLNYKDTYPSQGSIKENGKGKKEKGLMQL